MKIMTIGNFLNPSWDGSIPDEEHIAATMESMGHNVVRVQRESTVLSPPEQLMLPDFILIQQWDGYAEDFVDNLRKRYPCLIIYIAFDYQKDGQVWHERLVNKVDLYLSKRFADIKYQNWRWFSQDFAPQFLDKVDDVEKDIDVLFTGTYLPWAEERNATLKGVDEKFNLTIHSVNPNDWKGFKNVQGPVMDEQLPALIARAKINLSIDHTLEAGYWSDRNAQIMACGGLVLFRYIPLSETVFKHYVRYFFSVDSCLQAVEATLKNIGANEPIRQAGYRYAHENLMVKNRVIELMLIIGSVIG